jgi:hypothetical protein
MSLYQKKFKKLEDLLVKRAALDESIEKLSEEVALLEKGTN